MLRSLYFQRSIVVLDALLLGFIIDRWTEIPLWGLLAAVCFSAFGLFLLSSKVLKTTRDNFGFNIDPEIMAILRSTTLALLFFIECAIGAWLILA